MEPQKSFVVFSDSIKWFRSMKLAHVNKGATKWCKLFENEMSQSNYYRYGYRKKAINISKFSFRVL